MACPLDAIDALSTACLLDGVEATLAARTPSTRLHMHSGCQGEIWEERGLDWNNLGGHEPARFRVVGQVLDAPERLREVVEALSQRGDDVAAPAQILGAPR